MKDKIVKIPMDFNVTKIAKEIYQNFPEASGPSFSCEEWHYGIDEGSTFKFKFLDLEEDKKHTVTLKKAEKGIAIFIEKVVTGKAHFYGLEASNIRELGNWDAEVCEAAMQCAIFGDIIYG